MSRVASAPVPKDLPMHMRIGLGRVPREKPHGAGVRFDRGVAVFDSTPPKVVVTPAKFAETLLARVEGAAAPAVASAVTWKPRHVELDKVVLRFDMYFKESVEESALEAARIRNIKLLYYVADDTAQLNETKAECSGIEAGCFVKRHRLPKADGTPLVWSDIAVGGNVSIYGRTFHVTGCDAATRAYFEKKGAALVENEAPPMDSYTTYRADRTLRETGRDPTVYRGKQMNSMKRFMEAALGNASDVIRCGASLEHQMKFFEHDGAVLRFYLCWDDRSVLAGDKLIYRLHYFLANDTCEIMETRAPNDGRPSFPVFLKRQPLAKRVIITDDRAHSIEDDNGVEDYYHADDFRVGQRMNVLGRDMLIYDADEFTFDWVRINSGVDMRPARVDVSDPVAPPIVRPAPPHIGIGSEEDSMGSVRALVPKPPKQDFKKLHDMSRKLLRFSADLTDPGRTEGDRGFVVTVYLADDTVSVYEAPVRNSGIVGGPFASRRRVRNPATGAWYAPRDFFVGATVTISGRGFVLTAADEATLNEMEGKGKHWTLSDVKFVLTNLKKKLQESSQEVRSMFRRMDKDKSGDIDIEELEQCLEKFGMKVTKQELITLMRHFDKSRIGKISYDDFCDAFVDKEGVGGVDAIKGASERKYAAEDIEEYKSALDKIALSTEEERHIERLMSSFAFMFETRGGDQTMRDLFRSFDTNKDHTLDRDEFRAALGGELGRGAFNLTPADVGMLEKRFFPPEVDRILYDDFMSFIRHRVRKDHA